MSKSHGISLFGEKGKSFGADLPHPRCYKVQKVPGYIGLSSNWVFQTLIFNNQHEAADSMHE